MPADTQGISTLDLVESLRDPVEAPKHIEGLLVPHDLHLRVALTEQTDRSTMVGLHMVHDEVVEGTPLEHKVELVKEDIGVADIHRIDKCRALIDDQIGIVSDSTRQAPHILKERLHAVIHTHIVDGVTDLRDLVHSVYIYCIGIIALAHGGREHPLHSGAGGTYSFIGVMSSSGLLDGGRRR